MSASEFRLNWQPLLAASIGLAMGSALGHYTLSLFGPALIAEFGWTKAQFALVGALPLATPGAAFGVGVTTISGGAFDLASTFRAQPLTDLAQCTPPTLSTRPL